ncbi:GntR family transcriptional regulator [Brevibacillus composti]|uniref:GntR family transcriptional regulator n=1 Tax=Brevibacillus composti TaxID=2796470 RepID=A0A7T5JM48_9BACL|nr:GntR family transcriptional regulator [Brevibacillus composti]QQE72630.1 GntR family transcriptional regulator [Brevibacillus composti]QUO39708.1 GntR family transcriptional regulator [Brevibacillus composti]
MKIIKPLDRPVLRDQIYDYLKKAIVTLELEPGQRIKDSDLAAEFGVSRTPVREALKRLEDEGLVESAPGSLTRVTPIQIEEAKNAFTVAATLHGLAARLAVPALEEAHLAALEQHNQRLQEAMQQQDMQAAVEADDAFHQVFLEVSKNGEIALALERIVPKIRRLEFAKFGSLAGLSSVEQHQAIIAACQAQDAGLASQLMEENWLSLGRVLTEES